MLAEGLSSRSPRHDAAESLSGRHQGDGAGSAAHEGTAACVTAIAVPDGLTDVQVRAHCRERYGVMISGGQGAGNLVRIGHMGPTANSLYPVVGLSAVGRTMADLAVPLKIGDGVEAALEVLSETVPAAIA